MMLNSILNAHAVRVINAVSSKKRLLQDISETAALIHGLPARDVADALQARETLGCTGVGHGVALPHARIAELDEIRGVFVRLERPLDFGSADRQPIDLVFALLAPANAGVDHLKALALIARTMRDEEICTKLRSTTDLTTLHAILTDAPIRDSKAA
ncbi:MAG: PTS lactose transporter subunit IIC [Rhodobacteraceae bacterium]|nr:PTS lactose transporter subunit IIC [Paracoccaceae bacterium]